MKKQMILSIMAALALFLTACGGGSARSVQDEIAGALALDLSGCEVVSSWDDHGGFHGDGTAFAELECSGGGVLDQIQEDSGWKAFPLDRTARALVYGVREEVGTEETGITVYQTGPYVTDDDNDPLIPEIRAGFYRLIDRHAQAGETDLLGRASLNFTLALYDTDTDTLYFCEMDT